LHHLSPRNGAATWKLKDQVLSAALSWFKHAPRYVSQALSEQTI
jgi:phosphatidylinositol 4-kinase